ncbi:MULTISPECIES: glycosyltransferase family 4 protein [unclassified Mycobacterium]|uniref:glycosyltransferase family 4 protein n=1 Tax=unclassified Mycobacterium TaxID=2642494 RepID=UPI001482E8B5|nr:MULTISPECIES: glycosyltransferase family 4 protein [unclassified Mycobacterium]
MPNTDPAPAPVRVLAIGPAPASPESRGGMATVMAHMAALTDPAVMVRVVPTYVDAARWRWLWVGVRGMIVSSWFVLTGHIDVLHVHLGHGGSVARKAVPLWAARLRGVPALIHAHSFDFAGWYREQRAAVQRGVRWGLRADQWIILGRDLADEYTACLQLDPSRVSVLRNPVRIPEQTAISPGGILTAVSLGRLGRRKGTYDIIRATSALAPEIRAALHIHLAGDGEVEQARTAVTSAGVADVITVHGWLDAASGAELLSGADIFVLPSYAEGLPMALLEAMASAVAVITSPVGSIAEVVRDGENGLLVAPGDIDALAAALSRLTTDQQERRRLAAAGRETVRGLDIADWEAQLVRMWKSLADR